MGQQNTISPDDYKPLQVLRSWLHSDITISQPETMNFAVGNRNRPFEGEGVTITIDVQNTAPESASGGNVVFTGVGLRIIDVKVRSGSRNLTYGPNKTLEHENTELRQQFGRGQWTSSKPFPAITPDEQDHGDVLFPRESIVYEMKVTPEDLPYLDIKVEGTISRRHLFHIVHEMEPLKQYAKPLLAKTFSDIDALNMLRPSLAAAGKVPILSSSTTLADIEAFRKTVNGIITHADNAMAELNKVYHATLNQELRDFMKQVIEKYITVTCPQ